VIKLRSIVSIIMSSLICGGVGLLLIDSGFSDLFVIGLVGITSFCCAFIIVIMPTVTVKRIYINYIFKYEREGVMSLLTVFGFSVYERVGKWRKVCGITFK